MKTAAGKKTSLALLVAVFLTAICATPAWSYLETSIGAQGPLRRESRQGRTSQLPGITWVYEHLGVRFRVGVPCFYEEGIDRPLLMERDSNNDGTLDQKVFYHREQNGSIQALTDDNGALVEAYRYGPYGLPKIYTCATPAAGRRQSRAKRS